MKKPLLFFWFIFVSQIAFSQSRLDNRLSKANEYYKSGKTEKALDKWKKVEKKATPTSATYGKAIRNLLYFYSQQNKERNTLVYYDKLMKFKLNSIEEKQDIGQSFLNTKYHATLLLAGFYKNRNNLEKALLYIDKAESTIVYNTESISVFANQKIDLAFWKYYIYDAQEKSDIALSVLLKRAFEYNYKAVYKKWHLKSKTNNEHLISQTVFLVEPDLELFKKELDIAISKLQYKTTKQQILFRFRQIDYKINTHQDLSVLQSKLYLKNSVFYKNLLHQIEHKPELMSKNVSSKKCSD